MKIAFGCDHGGFEHKSALINFLEKEGHEVIDCGCFSAESCDYPDFASAATEKIISGVCNRGILICGTGVGISIAANKFHGIRAAVCWSEEVAKLVSGHNDANILCLPGRFSKTGLMSKCIKTWLSTPFSNEQRHINRINKIKDIEKRVCNGGNK